MVLEIIRYTVFGLFVVAGLVAAGGWAVRTRRINPFSSLGRFLRKVTDPVLEPVEQRLVRSGGNPQNAGWWVFGGAVAGGIVVITLAQWLSGFALTVSTAAGSGPAMARLIVDLAFRVLTIALVARVIGAWMGVGRYNRWMRPAYVLTDWIVDPLRRVIPPIGMVDISPIAAYFALLLARSLILWLL